MQISPRTVTCLPLTEIWNDHGRLDALRVRHIDQEGLRQMMQAGPVRFLVAAVGHPLRWVPPEESHVFWKLEVRPHLVVEPDRPFNVYHFPEGYCFVASEWLAANGTQSIVLLEQHQ